MKILHIIIKRKYFDQIAVRSKTIEYRIVKEYWIKKLVDQRYDSVIFQAGYRKDAPRMEVEYLGYLIQNLKHEFFGDDPVIVFAIKLGDIIQPPKYL